MIYPNNKETIKAIRKITESNLVDYVGGSQSVEEWSREVIDTYHRSTKKRPELMVLVLERWGECYNGEMYISKEDFQCSKKQE